MNPVFPPPFLSVEERVAMAARCRDCDSIAKVPDAGRVVEKRSGARVQIMHNGIEVEQDGYCGAWMTDIIRLCQGHHEPQEERIFHEVVSRLGAGGTMIELGGYWSYYSLWFMQGSPDRQAIVLEPDPAHLEVGRRNAKLNSLQPIFVQGSAGGHFEPSTMFTTEDSGAVDIPCHTVESLMALHDVGHLSILHCDAQGVELDILESCRDLFAAGKIDWVFVSTHAHMISGDYLTHQRCLQTLRDAGAVIEAEHDVHESFTGDGLIVARFCKPPVGWQPIALSHNRHDRSLFRGLAYDLAEASQASSPAIKYLKPGPALEFSGFLFRMINDSALGAKGDTLAVPYDQQMLPAAYQVGALHSHDVAFILQHIDPGKNHILLDIGANIGMFSRQAAREIPSVNAMICVEPDPENFAALRVNVAGTPEQPAKLFNVALGNADATEILFRDNANIGNFSLNPHAVTGRAHGGCYVDVKATASWMREHLEGTGAIIWKSDTQGYDELIISETPEDIWGRVEVAIIEMWRLPKPNYDRQAFRDRIAAFPNRKLGPYDNISVDGIEAYLAEHDWTFHDLYLWR
jgi:FkbM family methyltransferase